MAEIPAPSTEAKATPKVAQTLVAKKMKWFLRPFFEEEPSRSGVFENEKIIAVRCKAIQKRVHIQTYLILTLVVLIFFLLPVLKPIYRYDAMRLNEPSQPLMPLSTANMTDQAILSWAATSITEILTFGFGDFDQRMLAQRSSFTEEGWTSFTKAIRNQDMRTDFKMRQLVLTTVPANIPVIVGKGTDEKGEFSWIVEMPVIMTYTTNNNVASRQKGIVRLTIVRVPPSQNVIGVGIKAWMLL